MRKVTVSINIEAPHKYVDDAYEYDIPDLEERIHAEVVSGVQDCGAYDTDKMMDGEYLNIHASGSVGLDLSDDIEMAVEEIADEHDVDINDVEVEYIDLTHHEDGLEISYIIDVESDDGDFQVINELDLTDMQRSLQSNGMLTDVLSYLFGAGAVRMLMEADGSA